jgi:glutamyl-tRNA reductase
MPEALKTLSDYVKNGVILSTCNRTEVYSIVGHESSGSRSIIQFLNDYCRWEAERFAPYLYVYSQRDAASHLFKVASGLDSMVVGEDQILGQVKKAYQASLSLGVSGSVLSHLFTRAIRTGKKARHQTGISRNGGSISSAAVQFAKKHLGRSAHGSALIVGAGETSRLTSKALARNSKLDIMITSRTYEAASQLAKEIGGTAVPFDQLPDVLSTVDLLISSTDAPNFIIDKFTVEGVMQKRNGRPLLMIDIALPRDIHPEVGTLDNVSLHDIDELKDLAELNRKGKKRAADTVEVMAEAEADRFMAWWDSQEVVPTIKALKSRAEQIRRTELDRAVRKLGSLSKEEHLKLEVLTSAIVKKLLHGPVVRLKSKEDGHSYVKILKELFQL